MAKLAVVLCSLSLATIVENTFGFPQSFKIPLGPTQTLSIDATDKENVKVGHDQGFGFGGIGFGKKTEITAGKKGFSHSGSGGATIGDQTFGVSQNQKVGVTEGKDAGGPKVDFGTSGGLELGDLGKELSKGISSAITDLFKPPKLSLNEK